MDKALVNRITQSYEHHPLTADAILERIRRQRGEESELTEFDLAIDPDTFITDQNHTGGLDDVLALARVLHLNGGERILDVGAGLGGTVRVLAHVLGCRCHGIELTRSRFEDCQKLTQWVGLEQLCTFSCGDFLEVDVPGGLYDVVIGQDTFMHFPDQQQLLKRCATLVHDDGWLVIEEGYVRRPPEGPDEARRLEQAWNHWNGKFHTLVEWTKALREAGFRQEIIEDRTELAIDEYESQLRREAPHAERREVEGWQLGHDLMKDGVIGMIRLACKKMAKSNT